MGSLTVFLIVLVVTVPVTAWALAWSARAVGSLRAGFRVGLLAVLLLMAVGVVFVVVAQVAKPANPASEMFVGSLFLVAQLGAVFFILRAVFNLSTQTTFAPFGVYLALGVAQFALAAFVVKPYLLEAFVLTSRSMTPTLEPGDRFVVNKAIQPRRFDLVAYWNHDGQPAIFCMRLIGLPGERIRFENGGLVVNDQAVELPPVLAGRCHAAPAPVPADHVRYRDGESIALGPDEFFVIGDNVDLANDSRLTGPSRSSSLVGVVDVLYWPFSKARLVR